MSTATRYALKWAFTDLLGKSALKKAINDHIDATAVNTIAQRIGGCLIGGNNGDRCWPPKGSKQEERVGFRIDIGELVVHNEATGEATRSLNVQFNKNANNSTIKDIARTRSHDKRIILEFAVNVKTNTAAVSHEELVSVVKDSLLTKMQQIGM